VTLELMGVSGAVIALVVLDHCSAPFAEPWEQRRHEPRTLFRVTMEHLPFLDIRLAGLVEQRNWDFELAHVVEESRPAQSSLPCRIDLQLIGEEVGEDSDPFGMTTGRLVVDAQREHQLDHRLHSLGVVLAAAGTGRQELLLELSRAASSSGDRKTSRRFVGKEERDVEQCCKGQEAAGSPLEDDQG
jgi:hypothetical protein